VDVGELISLYRRQAGLTIDELAAKSGVPKGTLNKIIGGVTKAPTLDNMKSIARALGRTLLDFDDEPKPESMFSPTEQNVVKKYRTLDPYGKDTVSAVLECEYRRCKEQKEQSEVSALESENSIILAARNSGVRAATPKQQKAIETVFEKLNIEKKE